MKISDYTRSGWFFFINWTFQHDVQIDTEEGVYIIQNRNKKENAFIAYLKWTIYVYDYADSSPKFNQEMCVD